MEKNGREGEKGKGRREDGREGEGGREGEWREDVVEEGRREGMGWIGGGREEGRKEGEGGRDGRRTGKERLMFRLILGICWTS